MPTSVESLKKQEFQKNIYFCFIDYAKVFVYLNKLCKILKEMVIPDHLNCLLRNLYAGQGATVRTGHGTTDCFQIGKGVHQALYCYPAYLTYMQITSCKMLGWLKHKLESGFLIYVNVWQKPLQHCKVISLQLIKILGGGGIKEQGEEGLVQIYLTE